MAPPGSAHPPGRPGSCEPAGSAQEQVQRPRDAAAGLLAADLQAARPAKQRRDGACRTPQPAGPRGAARPAGGCRESAWHGGLRVPQHHQPHKKGGAAHQASPGHRGSGDRERLNVQTDQGQTTYKNRTLSEPQQTSPGEPNLNFCSINPQRPELGG